MRKQRPNVTPRARPEPGGARASCRSLVAAPAAACRRSGRVARSPPDRPGEPASPPTGVPPGCSPARGRQRRRRRRRSPGPTGTTAAARAARLDPHGERPRGRARRLDLGHHQPARAQQLAQPGPAARPGRRRCRCCRRAAAPCPSGPRRAAGRTPSGAAPVRRAGPPRRRRRGWGRRRAPCARSAASAATMRPGPQPTSSTGSGSAGEQGSLDVVGVGAPAVDRQVDALAGVESRAARHRRRCRPTQAGGRWRRTGWPGARPARRRPRRTRCRRRCRRAARRCAGPGPRAGPCWRAPVSGRLVGTPRNARGWGRRRPTAHQPPSVAGPSTASTPGAASAAHGGVEVVGRQLRRVHADLQPRVRRVAAHAAVRRRSSPPSPWSTMSTPGGHHGPGRPSRASTPGRRPRRRRRRACRPGPQRRGPRPRRASRAGTAGSSPDRARVPWRPRSRPRVGSTTGRPRPPARDGACYPARKTRAPWRPSACFVSRNRRSATRGLPSSSWSRPRRASSSSTTTPPCRRWWRATSSATATRSRRWPTGAPPSTGRWPSRPTWWCSI